MDGRGSFSNQAIFHFPLQNYNLSTLLTGVDVINLCIMTSDLNANETDLLLDELSLS